MGMDVIIESASRPVLLKQSIYSFLENVKYSGFFRMILHEDFVNYQKSQELIAWAETSKIFSHIITTSPAQRLTKAIWKLLVSAEGEYIFNWEDDWIFNRKIDLDELLVIMDQYNLNQITLNNKTIGENRQLVLHKEDKSDYKKSKYVIKRLSKEWPIGPGIWRLPFVRKHWRCENLNIYGPYFYGVEDPKVCWFGNMHDSPLLKHIGNDNSSLGTKVEKPLERPINKDNQLRKKSNEN